MKTKKLLTGLLILTMTSTCFLGCGKNEASDIPFTELGFDTTFDEMTSDLGDPLSDKEVYLGTTYTYDSDYLELPGNVQYTFDEEGKMASISWVYTCEDGEEITGYYNDIHTQLENKLGKSKESTNNVTHLADIWRLDSGNIELIALVTSDYNAIMYTYLSPEHSTSAEEIANNQ